MRDKNVAIVIFRGKSGKDALSPFIKYHVDHLAKLQLYADEFPLPTKHKENVNKPVWINSLIYLLKSLRLFAKLKLHKIEVVLAEFGTIGADIYPFLKQARITLVVEFRGFDATVTRIVEQYKERYKEMFQYASFCVAKSSVMKKDLVTIGCPENKVKIIPSGFNAKAFDRSLFSESSKNFVFVGRLVEVKGPEYVIRAFAEVIKKHPESRLIMIGDGPLYNDCMVLTKELGISDKVNFTGTIQQDEIVKHFSTSIALINHSITASNGAYEGMPSVILEANASGLPVIASKSGGIVDSILHSENGCLVKEREYHKIAEYMKDLLEHPKEAKRMGEIGRKRVLATLSNEVCLSRLKNEINHTEKASIQ